VAEIESRCKPWTVEAADVSDESDLIKRFDLLQTVQRRGGETADKLLSSDDQPLLWTAIMRGALQQALYETLPNPQDHVQFGKKLVRIESENDVCYCHFADGSRTGPFDVVVGCDGINSVVKQYVDQGERLVEKGVDADTSAPSALYSGLRIRYAVSDGDPGQPAQTAAALKQYFGNGAYALHGTYGAGSNRPSTQCSFIVYLDDNYVGPFQKRDRPRTDKTVLEGENADWSQDVRQTVEVSRRGMLDQLAACGIPHSPESDLGRTIRQADRFFELGSYFHNPFCRWSRQLGEEGPCLVLCGDSGRYMSQFVVFGPYWCLSHILVPSC
jgi:2-polyprenyl-6-methoxyphenol hydroxylase-like FAD-dependent oxidoreductase